MDNEIKEKMLMTHKNCADCKKSKLVEEFDKNSKLKTGYSSYCTECRRWQAAETRERNKRKNHDGLQVIRVSKKCGTCGCHKPVDEFAKSRCRSDGLYFRCKVCHAEYGERQRKRVRADREAGLLVRLTEHLCTECKRTKAADMFHKDSGLKTGLSCYCKACDGKLKSIRHRKQMEEDVEYRMLQTLKKRTRKEITVESNRWISLLGCSTADFVQHLQGLFHKGMSWINYGKSSKAGCYVYHDLPCKMFALDIPAEQHRCFHFTNQQPMWSKDNLAKGSKVSLEDDILSSLYRLFDPELEMW